LLFKVGLDETAHRVLEILQNVQPDDLSDADKPPYTVWISSYGRHTRLISLVHTLVLTFKMFAFDKHGKQQFGQEAALPTLPVDTTDHVCVGKAVWNAIKLRVLHKEWTDWVRDNHCFGLLIILAAADRASSNLSLFSLWSLVCHHLGALSSKHVVFCHEPCGLHQCHRGNAQVNGRTRNVSKTIKKALGLLRLRRSRVAYENGTLTALESDLVIDGVARSEQEQATAKDINRKLAHIFTYSGCARKYMATQETREHDAAQHGQEGSEEAVGEAAEPPRDLFKVCQRDHAIEEFLLRYLTSSAVEDKYSVSSNGRSQADVVKYGKRLWRDILFFSPIPPYNEQRWLKYTNAIEWFSLSALLGGAGFKGWALAKLQKPQVPGAAGQRDSNADKRRIEDGIKLQHVRTFAKNSRARFYILVLYALMKLNEQLVFCFFAASEVTLVDAKRRRRLGKKGFDERRDLGARRISKGKVKMHLVMDAVERHVAALWLCAWHGHTPPAAGGAVQEIWPLAFLAEAYYPPDDDVDGCFTLILDTVLQQLSEYHHRFLCRHRRSPHDLIGKPANHPAILRFLEAHDCCIRQWEGLQGYCVDEVYEAHGTASKRLVASCNTLNETLDATSLAQEHLLSSQRQKSQKFDRSPGTYARASAEHVKTVTQAQWDNFGGRDLSKASSSKVKRFKAATSRKIYRRVNQLGSPMTTFWTSGMTMKEK
jgi:hypothetical protein